MLTVSGLITLSHVIPSISNFCQSGFVDNVAHLNWFIPNKRGAGAIGDSDSCYMTCSVGRVKSIRIPFLGYDSIIFFVICMHKASYFPLSSLAFFHSCDMQLSNGRSLDRRGISILTPFRWDAFRFCHFYPL